MNGLLGYVNLVGAQSTVLAVGNAVGLLLSATALTLVVRYRAQAARYPVDEPDVGSALSTLLDQSRAPLADLPTDELETLQGAVIHARETRERHRQCVHAG